MTKSLRAKSLEGLATDFADFRGRVTPESIGGGGWKSCFHSMPKPTRRNQSAPIRAIRSSILSATMVRVVAMLALCVWPAFAQDGSTTLANGPATVQGKPVSEWITQLRSENRGLQMRAARALSEAPAEARPALVPLMIPLLKSERENDRFVAAQVLGECGPLARPAVPELVPLLKGTQFSRSARASV